METNILIKDVLASNIFMQELVMAANPSGQYSGIQRANFSSDADINNDDIVQVCLGFLEVHCSPTGGGMLEVLALNSTVWLVVAMDSATETMCRGSFSGAFTKLRITGSGVTYTFTGWNVNGYKNNGAAVIPQQMISFYKDGNPYGSDELLVVASPLIQDGLAAAFFETLYSGAFSWSQQIIQELDVFDASDDNVPTQYYPSPFLGSVAMTMASALHTFGPVYEVEFSGSGLLPQSNQNFNLFRRNHITLIMGNGNMEAICFGSQFSGYFVAPGLPSFTASLSRSSSESVVSLNAPASDVIEQYEIEFAIPLGAGAFSDGFSTDEGDFEDTVISTGVDIYTEKVVGKATFNFSLQELFIYSSTNSIAQSNMSIFELGGTRSTYPAVVGGTGMTKVDDSYFYGDFINGTIVITLPGSGGGVFSSDYDCVFQSYGLYQVNAVDGGGGLSWDVTVTPVTSTDISAGFNSLTIEKLF